MLGGDCFFLCRVYLAHGQTAGAKCQRPLLRVGAATGEVEHDVLDCGGVLYELVFEVMKCLPQIVAGKKGGS